MNPVNEITKQLMHSAVQGDELMHYGVMGMHWGIRRYQPYPASYDGDGKFIGKKEFRKQFVRDRARVDELTKDASIAGAALTKAQSRAIKYGNKMHRAFKKDPNVKRNTEEEAHGKNPALTQYSQLSEKSKKAYKKYSAADAAFKELVREHAILADKLTETVSELKKKYGDKNVRDVVYKPDKHGNMVVSERVTEGADWLMSVIASGVLGTVIATMPGMGFGLSTIAGTALPIEAILRPRGRNAQGRYEAQEVYNQAKEIADDYFDIKGQTHNIAYVPADNKRK